MFVTKVETKLKRKIFKQTQISSKTLGIIIITRLSKAKQTMHHQTPISKRIVLLTKHIMGHALSYAQREVKCHFAIIPVISRRSENNVPGRGLGWNVHAVVMSTSTIKHVACVEENGYVLSLYSPCNCTVHIGRA